MKTPLRFLPQYGKYGLSQLQQASSGETLSIAPPGGPAHRQPLRVQNLLPRMHWRRGCPRPSLAHSLHPHHPSLEPQGICALPWGPHSRLGQEKGRNWLKTTQPEAGAGRGEGRRRGELKLEPRALPHHPGFPDYLSGRHDTPGRWGNGGPRRAAMCSRPLGQWRSPGGRPDPSSLLSPEQRLRPTSPSFF